MQIAHAHAEASADILRRIGTVLIAAGLLDLACLIWAFSRGLTYVSTLNVFAIVAGVRLWRGSLRTARMLRWLAAFSIAAYAACLFAVPAFLPFELIRAYVRTTSPLVLVAGNVVFVASLALFFWMQRMLDHPSLLLALSASDSARGGWLKRAEVGACLGAGLTILLVGALPLLNQSAPAKEAILRARHERGPSYDYFVTSISVHSDSSGAEIQATVLAYTDSAIERVRVTWQP
jgi:hypothetical protein